MRSWLRKFSVSRAARSAANQVCMSSLSTVRASASPVASRQAVVHGTACETLEGRVFLSASTFDLTNTYGGSILLKIGKHKVKEAITLTFISENGSTITGQVSSAHFGTVNVEGTITGKTIKVVGTSSGGLITAKIGKHGLSLAGKLINGADSSVGKFKIKVTGDAPSSLPPATTVSLASNQTIVAASTARARALTASASTTGGALDPTIDPTTGLPINPQTGGTVDPSQTPGDPGTAPPDDFVPPPTLPSDFPTPQAGAGAGAGAGGAGGGGGGAAPAAAASGNPGTLIGANYDFIGLWDGQFNFDSSGDIVEVATGLDNVPAVNGTRPGPDPRVATFTTASQDVTGLVAGTLDVAEFGTFIYTGFVNVTSIDLVLSGTSNGAVGGTVHLDLNNTTFDSFVGTLSADANGFHADGPIIGTFTNSGGGGSGLPLPAGEEMYHVDTTNGTGGATIGNFDPNGASLGEDFSVGTTPIIINSLGAFDDNADGLKNTIRVAIYNTLSPATPIVISDITTDTTELVPGSSFRYLTTFTPVTLTTGVYRIVAFGYGGQELAGDTGVSTYTGPVPVDNTGSTGKEIVYPISNTLNANNYFSNNAGGGGGGGGTTLTYPTLPDGLPLNRYLAGSILFEEGTPPDPNGGGGGGTVTPPTPLVKGTNSAFPGGVLTSNTGPEVFGSQSGGIIP